MPDTYLGYGFGLGALLTDRGTLDGLVFNGTRVSFKEISDQHYSKINPSSIREFGIVPRPGYVVPLWDFPYEFESNDISRTLTIDPQENSLEFFFTKVTNPFVLTLSAPSCHYVIDDPLAKTSATAGSTEDLTLVFQLLGPDGESRDIDATERFIRLRIDEGCRFKIVPSSAEPFENTTVIANDYSSAACVCSIFHEPRKLIPLVFAESGSISNDQRDEINRIRLVTKSTSFVFIGIEDASIDSMLWDKPDHFRSACRAYRDLSGFQTDAAFDHIPVIRCPEDRLPQGLLHARRSRQRLIIDNDATLSIETPVAERKHLVSFEGIGQTSVIAANFAYYCDADLADVGFVPRNVRESYQSQLSQIQQINDEESLTSAVDALRHYVRAKLALNVSGRTSLTAFTYGMSYSVAYSLPVGHVLEKRSAATIIQNVAAQNDAVKNAPFALLLSTNDFAETEISATLANTTQQFICYLLQGNDSTKLNFLLLLQMLSSVLTFIVAHGAEEEFYEDTFEVHRAGGKELLKIRNSNREIPDFSSEQLQGVTSITLLERKLIDRSSDIEGIQLNDALITAQDVRDFFRSPVAWGVIVNNSCASWTSLGAAIMDTGSAGYVGTLWPVGEEDAQHVGAALLRARPGKPISQVIFEAASERGAGVAANYVYAGTPLITTTNSLLHERSTFSAVAIAQAHLQHVVQRCPDKMLSHIAEGGRHLMHNLHQIATERLPDSLPVLHLWMGELEAIIEGRLGALGASIEHFEDALRSLPRVSNPDDSTAARLSAIIFERMAATYQRFGLFTKAASTLDRAEETVKDPHGEIMIAAAAYDLAVNSGREKEAQSRLLHLRRKLEEAGMETTGTSANAPLAIPASDRADQAGKLEREARNRGFSSAFVVEQLFTLAEAYRDGGQIDEAIAAYERCIDEYKRINDQISLAQTYNNLAIVYRIRHDNARAKELFKLSLSLKRQVGGGSIANTLLHLSDLEEDETIAIKLLDEAIETGLAQGYQKPAVEALISKGRRKSKSDDGQEAVEILTAALDLAEKAGNSTLVAGANCELGIALLRLSRIGEGLPLIIEGHQELGRKGLFTLEFQRAARVVDVIRFADTIFVRSSAQSTFNELVELTGAQVARELLRLAFYRCMKQRNAERARQLYGLDPSAFSKQDREMIETPQERATSISGEHLPQDEGETIARATEHCARGATYRQARRWSDALAEFKRALDIFQQHGDKKSTASSLGDIASCLTELGDIDQADTYFRAALKLHEELPPDPDAVSRIRNNLGFLYQRSERPEDALQQFKLCLAACNPAEGNPVAILACTNIGEMSLTLGDIQSGIQAFLQVLSLSENAGNEYADNIDSWVIGAHLNLASAYLAQDETDESMEQLRQGISKVLTVGVERLTVPVWPSVALLLDRLASEFVGPPAEALNAASQEAASGSLPNGKLVSALLTCGLGLIRSERDAVLDAVHTLRKDKQAELAARFCQALIDEDPRHRRTHLVYAACLADCGNRDEGLKELDWCIASDPLDPIAHHNKAVELQRFGRHEECIVSAQRAIDLDRKYLSARWFLATSLIYLDRTEPAKKELLKLAEIGINADYGEMARSLYGLMVSLSREEFVKAWSGISRKLNNTSSPS